MKRFVCILVMLLCFSLITLIIGDSATAAVGSALTNIFTLDTRQTTVEEHKSEVIPKKFDVFQNYPNPFNSETAIRFDLPEKAFIRLSIYNLSGQIIRTLVYGYQKAGSYSVPWNGRDDKGRAVASGVYIYRLEALDRGFVEAKRMVLLR